jgi:hypothetical protein
VTIVSELHFAKAVKETAITIMNAQPDSSAFRGMRKKLYLAAVPQVAIAAGIIATIHSPVSYVHFKVIKEITWPKDFMLGTLLERGSVLVNAEATPLALCLLS